MLMSLLATAFPPIEQPSALCRPFGVCARLKVLVLLREGHRARASFPVLPGPRPNPCVPAVDLHHPLLPVRQPQPLLVLGGKRISVVREARALRLCHGEELLHLRDNSRRPGVGDGESLPWLVRYATLRALFAWALSRFCQEHALRVAVGLNGLGESIALELMKGTWETPRGVVTCGKRGTPP